MTDEDNLTSALSRAFGTNNATDIPYRSAFSPVLQELKGWNVVLKPDAWDEAVRRVATVDLTKAGQAFVETMFRRIGHAEQARAQYARTKPKIDALAAECVRTYGMHLLEKAFHSSIQSAEYLLRRDTEEGKNTEYAQSLVDAMHAAQKPAALTDTFDRFRKAVDAFSHAARWLNEPEEDAYAHTVRISETIGMSGKNRITVVGEIQQDDALAPRTIVFHFGAENRGAWLSNYRQRVGGSWRAVDPSGRLLEYNLDTDYDAWKARGPEREKDPLSAFPKAWPPEWGAKPSAPESVGEPEKAGAIEVMAMPMPKRLPRGWKLKELGNDSQHGWRIFRPGSPEPVASINISRTPEAWVVSWVRTSESGYGAFLYETAMKWVSARGEYLARGDNTTDSAAAVWDKYHARDDVERTPYEVDPTVSNHGLDAPEPRTEESLKYRYRFKPKASIEVTAAGVLPFLEQCDRLRMQYTNGEAVWQEMIQNARRISLEELAAAVDPSRLLDEDETLEDFIADDPDAGFYASSVQGEPVYFVEARAFEFLFGSPRLRSLFGTKRAASAIEVTAAPRKAPAAPAAGGGLVALHNLREGSLLHAQEVGGLISPSIAITKASLPFENFGEITLVAPMSLVDPKTVPVFDADIYSARYPNVRFKPNYKEIGKFRKRFEDQIKRTETYYGDADDTVERKGYEGLMERASLPALQLAFLEQVKGMQIPTPTRAKPLEMQWVNTPRMQRFFTEHGYDQSPGYESDYHKNLSQAVREAIPEYWSQVQDLDDDDRQMMIDTSLGHHLNEDDGMFAFGRLYKVVRDHQAIGQTETDKYAFQDQLAELIKPYEAEFKAWAIEQLKPLQGDRYLTSEGGRKMQYNPENVLRLMTQKLKGAESFNYGLGSLRAKGANRFRSLDHMAQAEGKIVSHEEFETLKKANEERFFELLEKLRPYHPALSDSRELFRGPDTLMSAIGESYKRGKSLWQELQRDGFQGVPSDLVREVAQFRQDLIDMPTEYFEAKPQRIVALNEFMGAAVPKTLSAQALAVLQENGLRVEYYNPEKPATRMKAVTKLAKGTAGRPPPRRRAEVEVDAFWLDDAELGGRTTTAAVKRARALFHGTTVDAAMWIRDEGLLPQVGTWVSDAYGQGGARKLAPLIFAADKGEMWKVVSAVAFQVGRILGKPMEEVTDDEIKEHGAVVKIKEGDKTFKHSLGYETDESGEPGDPIHYPQTVSDDEESGLLEEYSESIEAGDWFSDKPTPVDAVYTGNQMITLFRRYRAWPRTWGPDREQNIRDRFLEETMRQGPAREDYEDPDEPAEGVSTSDLVRSMSEAFDVEELRSQLKAPRMRWEPRKRDERDRWGGVEVEAAELGGARTAAKRRRRVEKRRRIYRPTWYMRQGSQVAYAADCEQGAGAFEVTLRPGAKVLNLAEAELRKSAAAEGGADETDRPLIEAVREQAAAIARLTVMLERLMGANKSGYDAIQTEDRLVILNPAALEAAPPRARWLKTSAVRVPAVVSQVMRYAEPIGWEDGVEDNLNFLDVNTGEGSWIQAEGHNLTGMQWYQGAAIVNKLPARRPITPENAHYFATLDPDEMPNITLIHDGNRIRVVDGEHRLAAAAIAGWETVPAYLGVRVKKKGGAVEVGEEELVPA
jgi:hypothetical protein